MKRVMVHDLMWHAAQKTPSLGFVIILPIVQSVTTKHFLNFMRCFSSHHNFLTARVKTVFRLLLEVSILIQSTLFFFSGFDKRRSNVNQVN